MSTEPRRDEASMADIMASIRQAVSEEERVRRESGGGGDDGVLELTVLAGAEEPLELTPEMRVSAPPEAEAEPDESLVDHGAGGVDEAAIADLVRAVVREELRGAVGDQISRKVRELVRNEVARTLAERGRD